MRRLVRGETVRIWYATKPRKGLPPKCNLMPFHGYTAIVAICPRGPGPRNYGVLVNGCPVVIPRGNLRPLAATPGTPCACCRRLFPVAQLSRMHFGELWCGTCHGQTRSPLDGDLERRRRELRADVRGRHD